MTPDERPLGARVAALDPRHWKRVVRGIEPGIRDAALDSWFGRGRPAQIEPDGDWLVWLILAGRGFGKTRAGAEWLRTTALRRHCTVAVVGATHDETRRVMVEGPAGLLSIGNPASRPFFEPSRRRLTWGNGSVGILCSADDPDSLRGGEYAAAWCDEIAKWPRGEDAWMNLRMALRAGEQPRAVLTTTPRPTPLVRALLADPAVKVTRGRTADNAANLAPGFIAAIERAYGGTRWGRQELDGELVEDVDGALWSRALIERCRAPAAAADRLARVVVAVDPPADGGACGIVVAGLAADGSALVVEDASVAGLAPEGWARAVVVAAERWQADRVVAEVNNGGAMVTSVLAAAEATLPVRAVRASRGKTARAEPVAALYERGRVRHAGVFAELEDELCGLVAGGGYDGPGRSPDRADALVWALTELLLGPRARPAVRVV